MDRGSFADRFTKPHMFTSAGGFQLELNQTAPSLSVSVSTSNPSDDPVAAVDELGTGTTVWRAGLQLARLLTSPSPPSLSHLIENKRVLELGSGTGLAGLAAGGAGASSLLLTDLPPVLPLLRSNVSRNSFIQTMHGCPVAVASLEWGPGAAPPDIDVILAADCNYHERHAEPLSRTVADAMTREDGPVGQAVLSCERHDPLAHAQLKQLLRAHPGLVVSTLWESDDGRVEVIGVARKDSGIGEERDKKKQKR
ncbi:hypothetical protein TeGR_g13431 [Tetraparma gracilis]|uniref:Methyltransferase-domain-containing protein n=1 Tax=Tetraparma gracilis TaxID=2962635 RepID=A0ABQ6N1Y3_9STRA|nr:hypothetical protein TeGR_g13431 [Tetraparma gracilis]